MPFQYYRTELIGQIVMYEFLFKAWIFLMYFKIPYDFTILRSVFTIRVCEQLSVPC